MHELRTRRKIEFADTDMGGIVHFSRFFIFMETAEHEFLDALGSSVVLNLDGCEIGWPRVAARCDYKSPARYGDVLDIHVRVVRKGRSSMRYRFKFRVDEREIATGEMTSVCCELEQGKRPRPMPIPEFMAAQIEEAPASE